MTDRLQATKFADDLARVQCLPMQASLQESIGQLTSSLTMMAGEEQFLSAGAAALPVLETIFSGEATNEHGVPYRKLGLPLRCALEIASRLGPVAKPLEAYICQEVKAGSWVAAAALRRMPPLADDSIVALADALSDEDADLVYEAARALLELGHAEHPAVRSQRATSPRVAKIWATFISRKTG